MRIQITKGWSGSWDLCKVVHSDEKKIDRMPRSTLDTTHEGTRAKQHGSAL